MANPNKAKGTRAETSVVRFLERMGWRVKRQPLSGCNDKGDIDVIDDKGDSRGTIEVKAGSQTSNPSRKTIDEWIKQAKVEAINNGTCAWYLVIVRYRRQLKDADVYYGRMKINETKTFHCWLDEIDDTKSIMFF